VKLDEKVIRWTIREKKETPTNEIAEIENILQEYTYERYTMKGSIL